MKIPTLEDYLNKQIGDALYFPNLDNQVYHNGPGISSSKIKRFSQSQLHALEEVTEITPSINFEFAAHALLVEGEGSFFTDITTCNGNPYSDSNIEKTIEDINKGLYVISNVQKDTLYSMKGSLVKEASAYLNPNKDFPQALDSPYSASLYWYEQGLLCRTRPSAVINSIETAKDKNSIVLVNFITTDNCSVEGFKQSVRKNSYYHQAAWDKRGFEEAGFIVDDVVFVAQEKKVPFANKVFKMNHTDMEVGWNYLSDYLEEYNKVLNGQPATIYNSPNVVELDKL
jgi:hypothetical protein